MKLMKQSVVGTLATALALTTGSVMAAGGFVGVGVTAAPDYEGGDDYVASPALFGATTWLRSATWHWLAMPMLRAAAG